MQICKLADINIQLKITNKGLLVSRKWSKWGLVSKSSRLAGCVITVPSGGTCTRNNQENQSRGIKYPRLFYTEGHTTIGPSEP